MARPWGMPLVTTAIVLALATWRPDLADGSILCSTVDVLCSRSSAREMLNVMWQVEGSALGLTVAAALFAFESAVRQRTSLSLHDYAERAGLMQFVMLGASGLIVVGLVLAWDAGRPPVAAATFALLIAGAGIAAFPFFVRRAMDVVGPVWFRRERLGDIKAAAQRHVRSEAVSMASMIELDAWMEQRPGFTRVPWAPTPHEPLEISPTSATVFDFDLGRLQKLATPGAGTVFINAYVGRRISRDATLVGATGSGNSPGRKGALTLVRGKDEDPLPSLLTALHEEALEAIRNGSPSAAEEVAEGYVELLLAWPRTWEELGQRVTGELLGAMYPFRIGPLDEVQRHLWLQLEQAVERGLREHVLTITSIPWAVAGEAIELRADDLVRRLNQIARTFVTASAGAGDMAELVAERCWRYHVEVCEFHAARRLEESDELEDQEYWASMVALFYAGITDLLRELHQRGLHDQFAALDARYRKILQFWDPADRLYLAEAVIEDPERFGASQTEVADAKRALAAKGVEQRLVLRRTGYRLSVLAWMLHTAAAEDEGAWARIRAYAQTLPNVDELLPSVAHALDHDGLLDRWVSLQGPELEAQFIDVDGPALRALVLTLLLRRSALKRIPPASWMSEHRVDRARGFITELLDVPYVREFALDANETQEAAARRLHGLLQQAEGEQREIEDRELISRELDPEKVSTFEGAVVKGWSDGRLAPALMGLGAASVAVVETTRFADSRFGFAPRLEPKGMFVTPTNWVSVDSHGEHLGKELALGEALELVKALVKHARPLRGRGTPLERLNLVVSKLRADGHAPSLILMPINWRLGRELGLSESRPATHDSALGGHIRGWIDGVPVTEWSAVPKDRLYVVDLKAFCDVEEAGIPGTTEPEPPQIILEQIDEGRADEIISRWDPLDDEEEEAARRRRVLTSVRLDIYRRYRVTVRVKDGARSVLLPQSRRA